MLTYLNFSRYILNRITCGKTRYLWLPYSLKFQYCVKFFWILYNKKSKRIVDMLGSGQKLYLESF